MLHTRALCVLSLLLAFVAELLDIRALREGLVHNVLDGSCRRRDIQMWRTRRDHEPLA